MPASDRTPLHRAMIAAGMTYVGADMAAKVEKALEAEGVALVPLEDLREALSDLATYIEQEYPLRHAYPSYRAKYDRDMAVVHRLVAAIGDHD